MSDETLTEDQVAAAGLDGWVLHDGALRTRLRTGDFRTGLALLNAIGAAAEDANHHPDLDLRYPHLDVTLSSHDVGGITRRDLDLARRISEMAATLGIALADPSSA